MSLKANALVTLAAAKAFIQPGGMAASDDPRLEEVINRVSDAMERHCNRPLKQADYTGLRLRGPFKPEFFLRHTPIDVTQPIVVAVDTVAQAVWRTEADGDPGLMDVIVARSTDDVLFTPDHLFRRNGWMSSSGWSSSWNRNPYNVVLTYRGGWSTIPSDLEEAALEIVKKVWIDQSKGLQDVTTVNLPSGGMTLFDAAFPRRAIQLLERFRRMSFV